MKLRLASREVLIILTLVFAGLAAGLALVGPAEGAEARAFAAAMMVWSPADRRTSRLKLQIDWMASAVLMKTNVVTNEFCANIGSLSRASRPSRLS